MMRWPRAPRLQCSAAQIKPIAETVSCEELFARGKKQSDRMRVLAAHADSLFREGAGIESARRWNQH